MLASPSLHHLPNFISHTLSLAMFLLYAKLEEEHGLARHAMSVYNRATTAVLHEEQFEVHTHHNLPSNK